MNFTVVNKEIDTTFRFMAVDWDGQIRMHPSSPYAMRGLFTLRDKYDISFARDTDHDRSGIVIKSAGLLPSDHCLSVCIFCLFQNRPGWNKEAALGKTLVSSPVATPEQKKTLTALSPLQAKITELAGEKLNTYKLMHRAIMLQLFHLQKKINYEVDNWKCP